MPSRNLQLYSIRYRYLICGYRFEYKCMAKLAEKLTDSHLMWKNLTLTVCLLPILDI